MGTAIVQGMDLVIPIPRDDDRAQPQLRLKEIIRVGNLTFMGQINSCRAEYPRQFQGKYIWVGVQAAMHLFFMDKRLKIKIRHPVILPGSGFRRHRNTPAFPMR